jgi:hypothetical protein
MGLLRPCGDHIRLAWEEYGAVIAPLCSDHIGLSCAEYGAVNHKLTTQEDGSSMSEQKVDSDVDICLQIHPVYGVSIKGVLIPLDRALIDHGEG